MADRRRASKRKVPSSQHISNPRPLRVGRSASSTRTTDDPRTARRGTSPTRAKDDPRTWDKHALRRWFETAADGYWRSYAQKFGELDGLLMTRLSEHEMVSHACHVDGFAIYHDWQKLRMQGTLAWSGGLCDTRASLTLHLPPCLQVQALALAPSTTTGRSCSSSRVRWRVAVCLCCGGVALARSHCTCVPVLLLLEQQRRQEPGLLYLQVCRPRISGERLHTLHTHRQPHVLRPPPAPWLGR